MSLERLAVELEETARQTGDMVEGIIAAMAELRSKGAINTPEQEASLEEMVRALQAQDRIEQRCRNMAHAVRALIRSDKNIDHAKFAEIWASLSLDELAVAEMSGIAAHVSAGDCDLF